MWLKDYTSVSLHGNYEPDMIWSIQVPVKIDYVRNLNEKSSLRFGFGPFFRYTFSNDYLWGQQYVRGKEQGYSGVRERFREIEYDIPASNFMIGLSPSATYCFRNFSIGMTYELPILFFRDMKLSPYPNRYKYQGLMLTIGVKFKSKTWKYIGMGVGAAAMVAGGVAGAYYSAQGRNQSSAVATSSTNNSSTKNSPSNEESSDGSKYNLSEQQSFMSDSRTYANYDSMLANHFAGNRPASVKEVQSWQDAMKKIREKWSKRGKTITKVTNETRSCNFSPRDATHSH